jgi:hypothetical protein
MAAKWPAITNSVGQVFQPVRARTRQGENLFCEQQSRLGKKKIMPGKLIKRLFWGLSVALLAAAGCAGEGHDKYIPAEDQARKAMETALSAWQNGERPGTFGKSPAVQVYDFRWSSGKQLAGSEILSSEADEEGRTWFTVRLNLKDNPKDLVVRYVVIGNDPLSVWTEENYKQASGS